MKFTFRHWRWSLPVYAAAICLSNTVRADAEAPTVELAQPIGSVSTPVTASVSDEEPTPAAPIAESSEPITPVAPEVQLQPAPVAAAEPATLTPAKIEAEPAASQPTSPVVSEAVGNSVLARRQIEPETTLEEEEGLEVVEERYPTGQVRVQRQMTQDAEGNYVPHGVWREFDVKGRLIVEGRYNMSERQGPWRRFYRGDEAPIFQTSPFKEFTGPFISQVSFHEGQMNGKWIITDARQRKASEIEFSEGQRHGKATFYYPNGVIMTQANYDHGRVDGDVFKWAPNSTIVAKEVYQSGRKIAPKLEMFDAQHKKQQITYLHAPLVVKSPDDWTTCSLAVFEARGQDERHGPFTIWHPNGQIARQGEYRFNLPVGKISFWYVNGQKQMEGEYVDGKQEGPWTWWHPNGIKSISGEYKDGNPVARWSWWKDDGKLAQKADLSSGGVQAAAPSPVITGEEPAAESANLELNGLSPTIR